ncbi:unnamed protein product [Brassicogethes aeneus]|uniref:Uncharacterized protein n=1 Tax=Brassicogethes aeneus TaxID=1431903 RepID=A0A9P0B5K6_BRAAE|nr:unnamed protein product [Brassicogethes aeneus]
MVYTKFDIRAHLAGRFKFFCVFSITFIATFIFIYFYVFNRHLIVTYDYEDNFDHLVFTQQWMPTYNTKLNIQNWTIHGLWPSSMNGNSPSFCHNITFDPDQIESLRGDMVKYWPGEHIKSGDVYNDSLSFWKHEWEKHGTCALALKTLKSEMDYFKTALDLHEKYNLLTMLQTIGFVPSLTSKYEVTEMLDKMTKLTGKNPSINCVENNVLAQISICMNNQFDLIDCPETVTVCNISKPISYAPIADVPQFDSLIFSQQWLPAYNKTMKSEWTIHGIWPNNFTGPSPLNCSDVPLDISQIQSILNDLNDNWPSCSKLDNPSFWSHEWTKHGTCAISLEKLATPLNYFNTGIELRQKHNISKILMEANITAGTDQVYDIKDIRKAFKNVPRLKCVDGNIAEIGICMNKSFNSIDCIQKKSNCDNFGKVKYEPSPPKSWDVMVLSQQWFPAFNKDLKLTNWTISHFWPQYNDGTYPTNCTGYKYESKSFSGDLVRFWPSVSSTTTSNIREKSLSL